MAEFRNMLKGVERSYDGFVHAVMTYIKMPGNEHKRILIEEYIKSHPDANSSDVLQFMVEKTGFFDADEQKKEEKIYAVAV